MSYELLVIICNRIEVSEEKQISVKIIEQFIYNPVPNATYSFSVGVRGKEKGRDLAGWNACCLALGSMGGAVQHDILSWRCDLAKLNLKTSYKLFYL